MRGNRAHYVKHNKVTRVPRAFIYLDSEANQRSMGGSHVQDFRLAVAALDRRQHHRDGWSAREWGDFTDADALWDWIDARCQRKARTVLVAHKLDYDLRITDALRQLTNRGWELVHIRLNTTQAWAHWKHDGRTLVMCDSLSWLAMPLAKVGAMIGLGKLDLPAWEDSDEAWFARCHRDVEIVAEAYKRIIEWVRAEDLGNWKATGAGQAWAAYRHRFMSHQLLVHENDDARLAEREAVYSGRCEAWSHGKLHHGPFTEWDYQTAYARIGAESLIPCKLIGETVQPTLFQMDKLDRKHSMLADCAITTDVPTVPCRVDGRVMWPVGRFRSTLWENEIQLARENGAEVEPLRAWWYARKPVVQDFCQWCLRILDESRTDVDPIIRAAVKHWSRALIGRFGSRWSEWEQIGLSPFSDVALGWAQDVSADERWRMLQLGHQLIRQTVERDSPDAVVSVMSWIVAECRVRLWRSIEVAGAAHVVYMDTDSLIVDPIGDRKLRAAKLDGFRVKGTYDTLEILGPRQIVAGGRLRASGIPRDAVRVEGDVWEADVWTQLGTSIASGEPAAVRITSRRVKLRGSDRRRRRAADGRTYPHRLDLYADLVV